jgi:hypothetical protein
MAGRSIANEGRPRPGSRIEVEGRRIDVGLRDRLEAIRAENEASYADPYFAPAPRKGWEAICVRVGNPWLSIWTRPRATIRAIVESDPGYSVVMIVLLDGFGRALIRAASRGLGDYLPLAAVLGVCAVAGPVFYLIALYLGGAILRMTGGWLGGKATAAEVRAALAWSAVPRLIALMLWLPALMLGGRELFTRARPHLDAHPEARLVVAAVYLADLVLLAWSFVLGLVCLAEVFRMSAWRVIIAALLAAPIMFAILFGVVYLVLPIVVSLAR